MLLLLFSVALKFAGSVFNYEIWPLLWTGPDLESKIVALKYDFVTKDLVRNNIIAICKYNENVTHI